ncbi:MAG: PrsW family intramembrane metalloprotease [Acidobacteriaceae bacterium]
MFCTQCGSACPPENKFCNHCGAPLALPATEAVASAVGAMPAQARSAAVPPAVYPGLPPGVVPVAGQPVYYVSPQAAVHPHTIQQINLLQSLRTRIQHLASTEALEGFSLKEMFSEVFRKRSVEEVEDYILVGSTKTTPPIDVVQTGWPKPWLFFRVLAVLVVSYLVCTFTLMHLSDAGNLIPAVMILGAFAVPLTTLAFFFEMNTPRNVSIHRIATLFLLGAVVSLIFALIGYTMPVLGSMGTMAAGIVEEVAKLLTVVIVVRGVRYKYILNGLLFGATVGAGFAAFETSGYALNQGLLAGATLHAGVVQMLEVLRTRAFLTPWGHVAWTAIAAGAFWRVKGDQPVRVAMLFDSRFLKAFMIPVVLHTIWDAPWQLPFDGNYIISALVSWYVVFGLVQQGLHQVKDEQRTHLQTTLDKVEASLQPPGTVAV